MLPSNIYVFTLASNETRRILVQGNFFKINSSTSFVRVRSNFGTLDNLGTGQGLEKTKFEFLEVTDRSGASNTVKLFIGDENFIDTSTQVVTNKQTQSAAFVNAQKTVTTASSQLVAANENRQYLMIQNKDSSGNIWINFGAGAATQANGFKIAPGGNFELQNTQTTGAIQVIGDLATQSNVVVIEG